MLLTTVMVCIIWSSEVHSNTLSSIISRATNKSSVLNSCLNICGRHERVPSTAELSETLNFRIVGGKKSVETIPWLAFLLVLEESRCAGAVITRRHVLTAAHCVCTHFDCNKKNNSNNNNNNNKGNEESVLVDVKQGDLLVFLGLTDLDAVFDKNKRRDLKHVYDVQEAIVHAQYDGISFDVSLLHLTSNLEFSDLSPICVPFGPDFPDVRPDAQVAGWGHVRNANCHTSVDGLLPNSKCVFPFSHEEVVHHACLRSKSNPSATQKLCVRLNELHPLALVNPSDQVDIVDEKNEVKQSCFAPISGEHGWCAACDARLNTDCEFGNNNAAYPDPATNWGFCDASCHTNQSILAQTLQIVTLTILRPEKCAQLLNLTEAHYDQNTEFCAGHLYRREIRRFRAINSTFFERIEQKSHLNLIGGKDACSGDSGAPLSVYVGSKERRAFVAGVVSRGYNCATNDLPGIYVRVKKIRQWIDVNVRDGHC